jgi:PAS domain S-box-containing protein
VDISDPTVALEHVDFGVLVQDTKRRIVDVNRCGAELLGIDGDDLAGRTLEDLGIVGVDADGAPVSGADHPAAVAMETGEAVRGEVLGVRRPRSGEHLWLQVTSVPARDDEGRLHGAVTTFAKISATPSARPDLEEMNAHLGRLVEERTHELARLLRTHRESEELHRAVIRAMAEGVVLHGADGSIVAANPAAEEILGLSTAQMQGRHPVDPAWGLTDEAGAALPAEEIPSEVTRRTGEPVTERVLRVHRPGGAVRWLSVSTDPVHLDGEPRPRGVVATFNDITAERQARLALEESRAFLRQVMAAVPGVLMRAVWAGDRERVTFVSDDVHAMLGLEPSELVESATALADRIHPDDLVRFEAERRSRVAGGRPGEMTCRLRNAAGEWRWIRMHATAPVPGEEGSVVHSTLFDVTEERRMEQGLRLAQRQEALGVLAGGIAHNFNNMLAVILPSLELAAERGGDDVAEALADAQRATEGASSLVRQLLRLARREPSGEVEGIDMARLVDDVVVLARRIFSRRIRLELERPGEAVPVMGRRDELEQVVLNLLINARDAVEQTSDPEISVRLEPTKTAAALTVRDNGCGMEEDVVRHLGQPFFTTKEPGRGTGLGMATALGIAADLGGRLQWRSPGPGLGSTFTLELPLARTPIPVGPARRAPTPPDPGEVQGARVLVVDDEPMVLKSVSRLLRRLVPEIATAPDGEEALRLMEEGGPFDAVLVDFSMPDMDGGEVTREVKRRWPEVPVLIMSGYVRSPDDVSAADGVIAKPFSGKELRDSVRPFLMDGYSR